jgi:hypothetical protein
MQRNTFSLLVLLLASGLFLGQNASGGYTEQFINYATGRLGDPGTGDGAGNWYTAMPSVTVTNGSGSLDGTALNLFPSFGDKASVSPVNDPGHAPYQRWVPTGAYPPDVATNIYYSFLYRFNDVTTVSGDGMRIIAVNRQSSGLFSSPLTLHWALQAKRVGSNIQLGINKYGGVTNYAATSLAEGQTFFVVVRQQIIPAANDVEELWINPPTNSFGAGELNVPAAGASVSDVAEDSSSAGPGRFYLLSSGQAADFDELRIANSWAEVTPPAGQVISASIYANPVSVTNVEGIGAVFSVTALCTDPTYQWQASGAGSSTWTNVNGATNSSYTTPNLWLVTDNGNQYRVIVNVPLDGSSATSTVATVTLWAITNTPVRLILYDTFADLQRDNEPVTTNNSVWRTAESANLDASTGELVATPLSGHSSLWLAYFVDESTANLPVSLEVPNAIVVTLPFHIGSMDSHTYNGFIRFGLYDYADGGVLLTNDSFLAAGSLGNGINVRGYMLNLEFGTNFTTDSPLTLLARSALDDNNLMGTTADYTTIGAGPAGGGYSNAPAFQPNTDYTLVFQVRRIGTNVCSVTATITGDGTNWTCTAVDTNFGYYRFDAFGIRPFSLEGTADNFTFPYFEVQVKPIDWVVPIRLTITRTGQEVTLVWNANPSGSAACSVQRKLDLPGATWNTLQSGITATNYTDTDATSDRAFYRVSSP